MRPEEIIVHVHGTARGNPGPAGVGAVLSDAGGQTLHELSESLAPTTAHAADYTAWIRGLERAAEFGARRVAVRSDSVLVIKQLKGEYRVRQPELMESFQRLRELLGRFERVRIRQISRDENRHADRLAATAARGETDPEGRTVSGLG